MVKNPKRFLKHNNSPHCNLSFFFFFHFASVIDRQQISKESL